MIGRYEPDCNCDPKPQPEICEIQVKKIPIDIEYFIRCRSCKKRWNETCVSYGKASP